MAITFDPAKRQQTLRKRRLDFGHAEKVFSGVTLDKVDDRFDYGETRIVTVGLLEGRMVVVVWTQRGSDRHVISMRKANGREKARYQARLG